MRQNSVMSDTSH